MSEQLELFKEEEKKKPIAEDQKGWYWCHEAKRYMRYAEWSRRAK